MAWTPSLDRRSIRLRDWDYSSAGWYFVTINTWGWCHTLARVRGRRMERTRMGEIVAARWGEIPHHYPGVRIDAFVVMPNHVHGIVRIVKSQGEGVPLGPRVRPGSLSAVIRSFKAASTRAVHLEIARHLPLWHRNYHDSILEDADALRAVRRYIANNPKRWIAAGR